MKKSKSEIEAKLKEIIFLSVDYEIDKESIDTGKDGLKKMGLNSLTIIKIMVDVEKEFDIEMDIYDTDSYILNSVCDLVDYIENKM